MKWWLGGGIVAALLGWWVYTAVSSPIPGTFYADLGREHVERAVVESTIYSSGPPSSGPHMVTWVKPGIYEEPQFDGELIHSLEHGYVIISYNCGVHLGGIPTSHNQSSRLLEWDTVYAHEEDASVTESGESTIKVATGSAITDTDSCRTLIAQLTEIVTKKKLDKLVLVPRPTQDTTLTLAAWNYVDAFDTVDMQRIERFIDYHRDHGPEQTME